MFGRLDFQGIELWQLTTHRPRDVADTWQPKMPLKLADNVKVDGEGLFLTTLHDAVMVSSTSTPSVLFLCPDGTNMN